MGLTRAIAAVAAFNAILLVGTPAIADVLTLKDGRTLTGVVTKNVAGQSSVTIRTLGGELTIPRERIANMNIESPGLGHARLGDEYMKANRVADALAEYKKAVELDGDNPEIAQKLAAAQAAQGEVNKQKEADVAQQKAAYMNQAQALAKEKKYDKAVELMKKADPGENSADFVTYRRVLAQIYADWGVNRRDFQDTAGASEKLQMAMRLDPTNEAARAELMKVYEGDPTKNEEVVTFYKDSTKPEDRRKYADALFRLRRYEEALPIYLEFYADPALAQNAAVRDRIVLMFDVLHRQYANAGNFQKAYDTYQKFLVFSPGEDPTPLGRYEYMIARNNTAPTDFAGRVKLARLAEERGLIDTAKEEYRNVIASDPSNAAAKAGLRVYADQAMEEVTNLYSERQYQLAVAKALEVEKQYALFPDLVQRSSQIRSQAVEEAKKIRESNAQQATQLAQRGDDYYQQGMSFLAAISSQDYNSRSTVFSPRNEAAKFFQRAILAWQEALRLDASLGSPTSYDLHRKIAEANSKYATLAGYRTTAIPLPSQRSTNKVD